MTHNWRKSHHPLLPVKPDTTSESGYSMYPSFPIAGEDRVTTGFKQLAELITTQAAELGSSVRIDGGSGVLWDDFTRRLSAALERQGTSFTMTDAHDSLLPAKQLNAIIGPHLGADDPIFGKRIGGQLSQLFDDSALAAPAPDTSGLHIVYGTGAALFEGSGPLLFVDVPKNEVQYRLRAGSTAPIGQPLPATPDPKPAYKQLFFVDWPLLERHILSIAPDITLFIDAQDLTEPRMLTGAALRNTLAIMASSPFRVRPWFEIGPWGGQWLKEFLPDLPRAEPNYAWSFELITPENGLILSDGNNQLEVAFQWLMALQPEKVLGEAADRFGTHFPIRFNYLDTISGGNLSVQVHPSTGYVQENFRHGLTQDETYYVVTTRKDSPQPIIYLGFQPGVDLSEFRRALEHSLASGEDLDVDRFVHSVPAEEHGLYLIPNGTIHSSGEGSLVLEISATTYLFTMKLYDWQRLDVDGKPRPINLDRGMDNLKADIDADAVGREHISVPTLLESGPGWQLFHLPTHERHFFDVHRFELEPGAELEVSTEGMFHALNVVEGQTVRIFSESRQADFSFAETFVVPAATGTYRLRNTGDTRALVVKAFVKPGRGEWNTGRGNME